MLHILILIMKLLVFKTYFYGINVDVGVSGIAGLIGALGFGAYKYKHRGTMSRSLFFVQLRVGAQGMVSTYII